MLTLKSRNPSVQAGDVPLVQPRELVILRLEKEDFESAFVADWIENTNTVTNELWVETPENLLDREACTPLKSAHKIIINTSINPPQDTHYKGVLIEYSGDNVLINKFKTWQKKLSPRQLIVSINIDDADLTLLGPTLFQLCKLGQKIFILETKLKPNSESVKDIRASFEFLNMVGADDIRVYFSFFNAHHSAWSLQCRSTFSGLRDVHIDLSNRCTHSCEFCGLYSKKAIDVQKARTTDGSMPEDIKKFMSMEIDFERARSVINSLPWTVERIQFGGIGDPLMHPHAVDIIELARNKGISVELLSNMDYLDDNKIERLHKMGTNVPVDMHFIVNCSGATAETYTRTRPRQSQKTFDRIVSTLKKLSKLREDNNGRGVHFTIMAVITRQNFHEVRKFVDFAKEVGSHQLFFKPVEVHADWMQDLLLNSQELNDYKGLMREALHQAKEYKIELLNFAVLESMVKGSDSNMNREVNG